MKVKLLFCCVMLSSKRVLFNRVLVCQGLSLVLGEGALKDGEEQDQHMEEDSVDAELLSGYQWLLQDLPKLPLFESVRGMTSTALQQVRIQRWRACGHLK